MLELPRLLLCPWRVLPGPADGRRAKAPARGRAVVDPQTGRRLGLVRWKAGLSWPGLGWLGRRIYEVVETEDESLLCTLYRPWSPIRGWEVYEADERLVAAVYSRLIVDSANYPLALVEPPHGSTPGRFVSPEGLELGTLHLSPEGTELIFGAAVQANPFARMALLGAALAAGG